MAVNSTRSSFAGPPYTAAGAPGGRLETHRYYGGPEPPIIMCPVLEAATLIKAGTHLMRKDDTSSRSILDVVASAGVCAFGVLAEDIAANASAGTVAAGTVPYAAVAPFFTGRSVLVEWSLTDKYDVTSASATNVVSTFAAGLDGGWMYVIAGTGRGQLRYIGAANSTTDVTVGTDMDFTTTLDATSDVIVIVPRFCSKVNFNSAGQKLLGNATSLTGRYAVLENYIKVGDDAITPLTPQIHGEAYDSLYDTTNSRHNVRFYSEIIPQDLITSPLA